MDRKKTCEDIVETFIRVTNKYRALEKIPADYGEGVNLYHSERHMLDQIGRYPLMNVTEFSRLIGVTKGAVSQVIRKLEDKGVVRRYKSGGNDKEVFIELTDAGKAIYEKHQKVNEESVVPLYDKLKSYSDDKVYFLLDMFKWFDEFLDTSHEEMLKKHK